MTDHPFRARRVALGLSMPELALLLEVSPLTVHRWETGKHRPRRRDVKLWARTLDALERGKRTAAVVAEEGL